MVTVKSYRQQVEHARSTNLIAVLEALGAQRDRYDRHKYRLPGSIISLTGDLYYDHLQEQGGRGVINLVMHVQKCDFRDAVDYLLTGHPWSTPARGEQPDGGWNQVSSEADQARQALFVPPERNA